MNNIISNELLSEVLSVYTNGNYIVKNTVCYTVVDIRRGYETYGDSENKEINIYELSHKCKEWAWNEHHFQINSGIAEFGGYALITNNSISFVSMDVPMDEPEAILKACEWILEVIRKSK